MLGFLGDGPYPYIDDRLYVVSQAGLQLTPGQVTNLRTARKMLLGRLTGIAAERRDIVSQLALQLLQLPPVIVHAMTHEAGPMLSHCLTD